MSKYIFQLRRGWKDDNLGRNDWAQYEGTKYKSTVSYDPALTYYLDKNGTIAKPQPTKSEVENGEYYIKNSDYIPPLAGELVLEYDNGVPRLKIGNGTDDFSQLPYMSVDSFILPTPATITLLGGADNWQEEYDEDGNLIGYTQTVEVSNYRITPNSKVDIQPNPEQLAIFHEKDVAFTAITDTVDGITTVTVHAIGTMPQNTYENVQVTVTEVAFDE